MYAYIIKLCCLLSLTDEENETDVEESYHDDYSYSYTFEPTETVASQQTTKQVFVLLS